MASFLIRTVDSKNVRLSDEDSRGVISHFLRESGAALTADGAGHHSHVTALSSFLPPSLAGLCRNFAALHHHFTVASRQLHANFTRTSRNFTHTSKLRTRRDDNNMDGTRWNACQTRSKVLQKGQLFHSGRNGRYRKFSSVPSRLPSQTSKNFTATSR